VVGTDGADAAQRGTLMAHELPYLLDVGDICARVRQAMRTASSSPSSSLGSEHADIDSVIDRIMTEPEDSSVCSRSVPFS
jgi:hypothetical protein